MHLRSNLCHFIINKCIDFRLQNYFVAIKIPVYKSVVNEVVRTFLVEHWAVLLPGDMDLQ